MSQPTDAPAEPESLGGPAGASPTDGVDIAEPAKHRSLGIALAIISTAQLMVVLDATIVNIALPHLQADLGFSYEKLPWVVNAYTLAFGGLLLLGGRAGDLLGRRRVFMFGVTLFAVASLLGGISQTENLLLASRVLQGVGAAIASPTSLSLITTTFPIGPARNRAFAVYAAMSGAGAAVGLLLGGALTEWSWRATFFINVPIGLLVAFLAPRYLAESERHPGRFDLPGAISGTLGLVSLVYGLTIASTDGWDSTKTRGFLAAGILLLLIFLIIEARSEHALMPFRVLANRDRATSYAAMLAIGAGVFAMFYFLGIYIQTVLGYSAIQAGVAFLPFSVGVIVSAQIASALVSRVQARFIAAPGAVVMALGMWWLTSLTTDSSYLTHLLGPILVISVGMGLCFVPLTLTAVSGVDKADAGVASAVLNTMQQIGGALGLALLSTVATSASKDKAIEIAGQIKTGVLSADTTKAQIEHLVFTGGATAAFAVGAGMVLAAAVIIAVFLRAKAQVAEEGVMIPGA